MEIQTKRNKFELNKQENNQLLSKYPVTALKELMKDSAGSRHRKTLEDILKLISQLCENERKLSAKCQSLKKDIALKTSKIQTAIQLSEEDKTTINALKTELQNAWKIIEEMKSDTKQHEETDRQYRSSQNEKFLWEQDRLDDSSLKVEPSTIQSGCVTQIEHEKLKTFPNVTEKLEFEGLEVEYNNLEKEVNNLRDIIKCKDDVIERLESQLKIKEQLNLNKRADEERDKLVSEIESNKLQIFELEEELTNKEKYMEELINDQKLKLKYLEDLRTENDELRTENDELRTKIKSNSSTEDCHKENNSIPVTDHISKLSKTRDYLKIGIEQDLFAIQSTHEKFKQLFYNNRKLSKSLAIAEKENKQIKTILKEKTKASHALQGQCNKLKNEVQKLNITMKELEQVRDIYVHKTGNLELKIHDLKKEVDKHERNKFLESNKLLKNELTKVKNEMQELQKSCLQYKKLCEEHSNCINVSKEMIHNNCEQIQGVILELEVMRVDKDYLNISKNDAYQNSVVSLHKTGFKYEDEIELISNLKDKVRSVLQYFNEMVGEKCRLVKELEQVKSSQDIYLKDFRNLKVGELYESHIKEGRLNQLFIQDDITSEKKENFENCDRQSDQSSETSELSCNNIHSSNISINVSNISGKSICNSELLDLDLKHLQDTRMYDDEHLESVNTECDGYFTAIKSYLKHVDSDNERSLETVEAKPFELEEKLMSDIAFDEKGDCIIKSVDSTSKININPDEENSVIDETGISMKIISNLSSHAKPTAAKSTSVAGNRDLESYRKELKVRQKELDKMKLNVEAYESHLKSYQPICPKSFLRRRYAPISVTNLNLDKLK